MLAVTGITGHTGKFFLEELKTHHYAEPIRCLVHTAGKAACVTSSGLDTEIVEGTLDCEADIRRLLTGADTVVHIANIHYSPEILRIGRECGARRFILVHTTGMFSKFKSASAEYREIEDQIAPMLEECGVTILRPTMIFGDICDYNISKFIKLVDRLPILPVVAGGRALIQPVNARDLAKALYLAMVTPAASGKAYNISGETVLPLRELYRMIADMLGKKRVIISFPMGLCVFGARAIRLISAGKLDLVEKVQRMGEDRSFSHEAASADFGYSPEPFETGLRREIEQYIGANR